MAVIINEFEIVVDQPSQAEGAQPQAQPAPSGLTPQAILELLRRHAERMGRLKAD